MKWEYRVLTLSEIDPQGVLNEFGQGGWELVTVTVMEDQSSVAYLKRSLRELDTKRGISKDELEAWVIQAVQRSYK